MVLMAVVRGGRKLLMASLGLMSGNWKLRRVTGEIAY